VADQYGISDTSTAPSTRKTAGAVRPLLWLALVLCAAGNAVTSTTGPVPVGIAFGLLTLACAAALIVQHRRHRA
jgi:hypothetical protein